MQQGSPVLGGGVVVHTGERGRAPGAVRLLLHAPLVGITDPDVRDLHPWGRPDPVGGNNRDCLIYRSTQRSKQGG